MNLHSIRVSGVNFQIFVCKPCWPTNLWLLFVINKRIIPIFEVFSCSDRIIYCACCFPESKPSLCYGSLLHCSTSGWLRTRVRIFVLQCSNCGKRATREAVHAIKRQEQIGRCKSTDVCLADQMRTRSVCHMLARTSLIGHACKISDRMPKVRTCARGRWLRDMPSCFDKRMESLDPPFKPTWWHGCPSALHVGT